MSRKEEFRDKVVLVVVASIVLAGIFLALTLYDAYSRIFQGAFVLVLLGLIVRSLRRRAWLHRMECWLEYIHETPREEGNFDFAITYRYNDQHVTFYGNKASRERAKMIALPPVESWPQRFPKWVFDKREFILKSLSYHYEVEWIETALYPILKQVDGVHVEAEAMSPSNEVPSEGNGVPSYSWKIKRNDPNDYKGRFLIYEEPGFRLVSHLEMSGVSEFDWLGGDDDLSTWTEPKDVPIDSHRHEELLIRLTQWCREHKIRISLAPGRSREEWLWDEGRRGNIVVHDADGSVTMRPPSRSQS